MNDLTQGLQERGYKWNPDKFQHEGPGGHTIPGSASAQLDDGGKALLRDIDWQNEYGDAYMTGEEPHARYMPPKRSK